MLRKKGNIWSTPLLIAFVLVLGFATLVYTQQEQKARGHSSRQTVYTCSMHPQIVRLVSMGNIPCEITTKYW
ncbi:MAG: hypothetical protein JXA30_13840 [Deltaproteobacteria bacterium]|nr:hypothetical protein [Deltaproteobacteria bacterium]